MKQINIFGGEDIIETTVDLSKFSSVAIDHIRLLKNVLLQTPVVDDLRHQLQPQEIEYLNFLRGKVVSKLGQLVRD